MTTFQAIIYGIIHGFAELLPIGVDAHKLALSEAFDWPSPDAAIRVSLLLGTTLAVFFYFIHDWASIISSFLKVILLRRKPMTLDERMPFFLMIATAPSVAAWYYLQNADLLVPELTPWILAGSVAVIGGILLASDSLSRKSKNMYDWNWIDSLLVGIGQALALVPLAGPAIGRSAGAIVTGLARNYSREASAKFAFLAALPLLIGQLVLSFQESKEALASGTLQLSWLNLGAAGVVSFGAGILAVGGMMKNIQRNGYRGYAFYRVILAVLIGIYFWVSGS